MIDVLIFNSTNSSLFSLSFSRVSFNPQPFRFRSFVLFFALSSSNANESLDHFDSRSTSADQSPSNNQRRSKFVRFTSFQINSKRLSTDVSQIKTILLKQKKKKKEKWEKFDELFTNKSVELEIFLRLFLSLRLLWFWSTLQFFRNDIVRIRIFIEQIQKQNIFLSAHHIAPPATLQTNVVFPNQNQTSPTNVLPSFVEPQRLRRPLVVDEGCEIEEKCSEDSIPYKVVSGEGLDRYPLICFNNRLFVTKNFPLEFHRKSFV